MDLLIFPESSDKSLLCEAALQPAEKVGFGFAGEL